MGDNNYEPIGNLNAPPPPPPSQPSSGPDDADNIYEGIGIGPDGPSSVPPPPPPPPPPKKLTQSEKKRVEPIRDDDGVDLDSEKNHKKKKTARSLKAALRGRKTSSSEEDINDEPESEKSCEAKVDSETWLLTRKTCPKEKKKKEGVGLGCKLFIVIVAVIVLVALGVGGYLLYKSLGDDSSAAAAADDANAPSSARTGNATVPDGDTTDHTTTVLPNQYTTEFVWGSSGASNPTDVDPSAETTAPAETPPTTKSKTGVTIALPQIPHVNFPAPAVTTTTAKPAVPEPKPTVALITTVPKEDEKKSTAAPDPTVAPDASKVPTPGALEVPASGASKAPESATDAPA